MPNQLDSNRPKKSPHACLEACKAGQRGRIFQRCPFSEDPVWNSILICCESQPYLTLDNDNREGFGPFIIPDLRSSVVKTFRQSSIYLVVNLAQGLLKLGLHAANRHNVLLLEKSLQKAENIRPGPTLKQACWWHHQHLFIN